MYATKNQMRSIALMLCLSLTIIACKKNDSLPIAAQKPDVTFYALAPDNKLLTCNSSMMGLVSSSQPITGLMDSDQILSIDFRPATGQLYGISKSSRVYIINTTSGKATAISMEPFSPAITSGSISIDFNPTVDRIRLIGKDGQNLRLHPETGLVVAIDGTVNGVSNASIQGVAYTNNIAGATSTTLYDIDATTLKLYKQIPPNDGTLAEVGRLNANFETGGDFDISSHGSIAFAALNANNKSTLYLVDTTSGQAKQVDQFKDYPSILGIAIPTSPVAFAISTSNQLIIFNPTNSDAPIVKAITGLKSEEKLLGLDFRPAKGQLYALGSTSQLYSINSANGAATAIGGSFSTPLIGSSFGFDFNPTVDRIRVVSNLGQNLRLHPETGAVAFVDGIINPGKPAISAAAYSNNFAGATTTTLFVIDHTSGKLFKQIPPNDGTLAEPVDLSATLGLGSMNGFDIGSSSGKAWVLKSSAAGSSLYELNLSTGAVASVRTLPMEVNGFTVGLGL